jgi:hypothetical protein
MTDGNGPPQPVPGTHSPEQGYQGGGPYYMNATAVRGLGNMLDQATGYCRNTAEFIEKHSELERRENFFNWFESLHAAHPAVVDQAASWFRKAADPVMATTASKIDTTVQRFERTESANAAAVVDAGVPSRIDTVDVSLPPWDKTQIPTETTSIGDATGPFQWVQDPAGPVRGVDDHLDDPQLRYNPTAWDLISGPNAVARTTIIEVSKFLAWLGWIPHPVDPLDELVKPVVGDWAGLQRFADVLRQAGDAAERTGLGIDRARHMLEPVWRGRSADACVVWLGAVATPLRDAPDALDAMADEYERAVQGAVAFRNLLYDLLGSCIDAAFVIAGALAIGGSAAPATGGISAAVAGLICGAEIIAFWNTIEKIRSAFNDAKKIMTVVEAVQKDFGNLHVSRRMPNLPSVSGDASALSVLPS